MGLRQQTLERDIQKAILDLLAAEHVPAVRYNTGAFRIGKRFVRAHSAGPGHSDICAWPEIRGKFGWDPGLELWRCDRCYQAWLRNAIARCICYHFPAVLWIETKVPGEYQTPEQKNFEQWVTAGRMFYLVAYSPDDVLAWLKEHRG
jgi:hypothetical protein